MKGVSSDSSHCFFEIKAWTQNHAKSVLVALAIIAVLGGLACYAQFGHRLFTHYPLEIGLPFGGVCLTVLLMGCFCKCTFPKKKTAPPLPENQEESPIIENPTKQTQTSLENQEGPPIVANPPKIPPVIIENPPKNVLPTPNQKLPKLTDEQRNATQGSSHWHSPWFKNMADEYHRKGDKWNDRQLQQFFKEGLLSHYIGEGFKNLGWDLKYNYLDATTRQDFVFSMYDKNKIQSARSFLSFTDDKPNDEIPYFWAVINDLIHKFKEQPILLQIGGDYQREKVKLEILSDLAVDFNTLLEIDQKLEKRQEVIFHWVQGFCKEVQAFIQKRGSQSDAASFPMNKPDFLTLDEYRSLLRS